MRIGLSGGGATMERMVEQARRAEQDGFTSLWYAGAVGGDPLAAMTLAGHATSSIELGTSVLQTYPVHPVVQARRALAAAQAMGRPLALGLGPSHQPVIEAAYGLSYAHPGRHTEEYMTVLAPVLRGEAVDFHGEDYRVVAPATSAPAAEVSVLVAALAARLLRVAGQLTDGAILWMANARAVESHIRPRLDRAAEGAGRPSPRIVVGLPVAVHDDVAEAREAAGAQFAGYGVLPNYRRILDIGGAAGPAEAAIVGDEASVRTQIQALFDAGGTDYWAAPFIVGTDREASRRRTRALLNELAAA
jgi:F420-dependent oxidoreductase-like protein